MIVISEIYGSSSFFRHHLAYGNPKENHFLLLLPHLYWFIASFLLYFVSPAIFIKCFGRKLKDFGLSSGDWKYGLKVTAIFSSVMLVILLIIVQVPAFAKHYPLNKTALESAQFFLIYESLYILYFFSWEFVFRGFLLFSLKEVMGNYAILVQTIPFVILHVGKPPLEVFASILAGIILGAFALRTGSMIYCFLLHAISAVALDLVVFISIN